MICITNPIEHEDWNSLLLSHHDCSFFHTSTWADILNKSYGYKPLYLIDTEQRSLSTVLPVMEVNSFLTGKRGVSLPYTDYCEPIISQSGQFQELFNFAIDYGKSHSWRYFEMRGGETFLQKNESSELYLGHTLDLADGENNILSKLRDSTKKNIKKAEKENVKVEIANSLNAMKEFYRLNSLTRRDHGLPPQPYHFFINIYDQILAKHSGFITLATFNNIAIATNVYFLFGEKVIYKYGMFR